MPTPTTPQTTTPIATPPVATPTTTPPAATPTTEPTNNKPTQQELSIPDLLFALTCYCYIFSARLGYEAINKLNQNLVVILENYSPVTEEQESEIAATSSILEDMKKDNDGAKQLALAVTGSEIPTPPIDTED
jgi:hypothetical protein